MSTFQVKLYFSLLKDSPGPLLKTNISNNIFYSAVITKCFKKNLYQYEVSQSLLHLHGGLGEPLLVESVHHHNLVINHRRANRTTANS